MEVSIKFLYYVTTMTTTPICGTNPSPVRFLVAPQAQAKQGLRLNIKNKSAQKRHRLLNVSKKYLEATKRKLIKKKGSHFLSCPPKGRERKKMPPISRIKYTPIYRRLFEPPFVVVSTTQRLTNYTTK